MTIDLTREVTVFVTTIGDDVNFQDCMNHLKNQTSTFTINIIEKVAPMSAAFQKMIDSCSSKYYVQVDEDMLLWPSAIESLYENMSQTSDTVGIICAPLWDCDVEMPIYGVKIYRHSILRLFPYADKASCEVDQFERMIAAGYQLRLILLSKQECKGEHGKHHTNLSIFNRWQRLFEKHRRTGHIPWIGPWPRKLLDRYINTGRELHLFAFLGAVAGIVESIPEDHSIDFRDDPAGFARLMKYLASPTAENTANN